MIKANAHTHLDATRNVRLRPTMPTSFTSWMIRAAREFARRTDEQCVSSIREGIARLLQSHTTHVGDISASWAGLEEICSSGLKGIIFLEIHSVAQDEALARLYEARKTITRLGEQMRSAGVRLGLSLHSPYACHFELLKQGSAWCRVSGVPLCIHVAESPAETALLVGGSYRGVPTSWLRPLHRAFPGGTPPRMTPVAYLDSMGVLQAKPLLVHAVNVSDADIQLIAGSGSSVVHCPRSNYLLSCGRMPLERYLDAGVKVYLGTDGLCSSPSLDVADEAAFAKRLHAGYVDPKRIDNLAEQPFP